MNRIFALIGVASVRFRFLIVIAWIVITILAVKTLPSLTSVAKNTTSGFLPATVPSIQASNMAAPFVDVNLGIANLVAVRDGGLTPADNAAIDSLETKIKGIATVKVVVDLGISGDGAARQILIQAEVVSFTDASGAEALVTAIRDAATAAAPAGVQVHLTGEIPDLVDNAKASGSSQDRTQTFSLLFILVLLVLAYRALLAPFLTLIPAVLVLTLAGPVIAQAAGAGIQVSSITEFMLIVLILGAGTDYGVFLVFRVREELRQMVTFKQLNLLDDAWPMRGRFDIIFCRNVMIYFDKPTQYKILKRFAPLLADNGLLFAGHSESFLHAVDLFRSLGKTVYELSSRRR